jgi:hypothetical protein
MLALKVIIIEISLIVKLAVGGIHISGADHWALNSLVSRNLLNERNILNELVHLSISIFYETIQ